MFKRILEVFKTKTQSYEEYLAECEKNGVKPKSKEEFQAVKKSC